MNKVQVGIIGAGPAGLTLALLLHRAEISCCVLENRTKQYVVSRVRAGLLEQNTVDLFNELGVGERMNREGQAHHGVYLAFNNVKTHINFDEHTNGRHITIYGQQEIVKDMIEACEKRGIDIRFECAAKRIEGIETDAPSIVYNELGATSPKSEIKNPKYTEGGVEKTLNCDFVAACDGFHGIGRKHLPKDSYNEYRIEYPFS